MVGLTVQNIAVFSNFFKVVWTGPQSFLLTGIRVGVNKVRVFLARFLIKISHKEL